MEFYGNTIKIEVFEVIRPSIMKRKLLFHIKNKISYDHFTFTWY